jgi:hypothetical protein
MNESIDPISLQAARKIENEQSATAGMVRKPYVSPELIECGPVSVLTAGVETGVDDFLGGFLV